MLKAFADSTLIKIYPQIDLTFIIEVPINHYYRQNLVVKIQRKMNIEIISGSPKKDSVSHRVALFLKKYLAEKKKTG